jgi:V/A-type H+-transporting ATPase subunit D
MGVKLMLFNFNVNSIKRPKHLNPIIDETSKLYVEILEYIVKTAEIENAVKKLLKEIERTKRRVNALEYNIIPELEREKKIIIQKLEELERDAFSSLKTIKNKISKSD